MRFNLVTTEESASPSPVGTDDTMSIVPSRQSYEIALSSDGSVWLHTQNRLPFTINKHVARLTLHVPTAIRASASHFTYWAEASRHDRGTLVRITVIPV